MAIAIRKPFRPSATKEFTDRTEPRRAFWNRYIKMIREGSTIVSFYGAGGVGKTALLKKIEDDIKIRYERTGKDCKYIKYDFSIGTDMREVLKSFKFQLSTYGCKFPLFDVGDYYYSLKLGKDAKLPKEPTAIEQIPWVKQLKKNLSKATMTTGNAMSVFKTTKIVFNATAEIREKEHWLDLFLKSTLDGLNTVMPIVRTITTLMSVADMFLGDYLKSKGLLDEDHKTIRAELNVRRQDRDPIAVYEYLPTLFAMDVTDWMTETGNRLVVFLDNYESLVNSTTTSLATTEQLKRRDLWLRGSDGLIFMIPDTLWTIAGRNKLNWTGELAAELDQHLIKALSPEDSGWFLKKAGITNETLRSELVKLTEGYPIFLDLCVDVYFEYKRYHNDEPTIDKFGQTREEVVKRIFLYLNAAGDDIAKDMLEFLCILNAWTDEIAIEIGSSILRNFSRNTYKRVKNFTFIQSKHVESEDISFDAFQFDKTIQSLLIPNCDEELIEEVKEAVDKYFKKMFTDKKTFDPKEIFYLKLWAEFIVRFANDADKILEQYKDTLRDKVSLLKNNAQFNVAEEILKLFMDKLESLNATDTVMFTYFEMDLGWLKRTQGKYKEARDITNSAYEKRVRLLGDEDIGTIEAMHKLAISLNDLSFYDEALKLQEKVLALRKKSLGEKHSETILAMNSLAVTLNRLNRYDEAIELQEQALTLSKEILGKEHPDTIMIMNNLASSLSSLGRHDEAIELQEQALTLSKNILGDDHPDTIAAMNNLAITLNDLGRHDEATEIRKEALTLSKEIFGDEHPYTFAAMNNLALSLNSFNRQAEAAEIQKEALALSKEILGDKHPYTIAAMNNLVLSLKSLDRQTELAEIREEALALSKHPHTIAAMNNLVLLLKSLDCQAEAAEVQKLILTLSQNDSSKAKGTSRRQTIRN